MSKTSPETAEADARLRVLVVDDEEGLRHLLSVILDRGGFRPVLAADGAEALVLLDQHPDIGIVLCDIRMPRMDGLQFLEQVRERPVRVVMMSAYGSSDTAVDALRRGAYDYVSKPFRADEIRACLHRIVDRDRLEAENRRLRQTVAGQSKLGRFVGASAGARAVMDLVRTVAAYPSTVLFTGESGTGKELLATALHAASARSSGPFVPINCAAIPENLLESELFGHVKGAFTGAVRAHAGLFEQANGGTLMLDEVGDMPLGLQTRLLRVLEDGRVRRVGGSSDVEVDVRVVAATATDLEAAVAEGKFRQDLFYRLNVVRVRIPPLRERRADIPMLTRVLVERIAVRLDRDVSGLSPEAERVLSGLDWPGNVRQLENTLERAVLVSQGGRIEVGDLPSDLAAAPASKGPDSPFGDVGGFDDLSVKRWSGELERRLIVEALRRTDGNRTQAAKLLEISYKALVYKIRDYGVDA